MPAEVLIPGEGVHCNTCGEFVEYRVCKSNANGNQGRIMALCRRVNSLTGVECSFFRWKRGSTRSPTVSPTLANVSALTGSPLTQPILSTQAPPPPTQPLPSTQPHDGSSHSAPPKVCPTQGCNQTRIHIECERRLCKKHCIGAGGCGAHGRTRGFAPLSSTAPPPSSATPASDIRRTSSIENFLDEPVSQSPPPAQNPVSTSIDPRPNPRYVSHMPPIFTEQYQREQELREETRQLEAQRQQHAKLSKHSTIVYAWTIDNEPPTIQEFQDGFTWPYFILSPTVLSDVKLAPPLIVQHYRPGLGTWVNVKAGHVVAVAEGDCIFLKASQVKSYPDFDAHLTAGAKSNIIHLRHNLPSERADVRKKILKQKAAVFERTTSKHLTQLSTTPDDDSTPPPPSRLMIKTKPLRLSTSSDNNDSTPPPSRLVIKTKQSHRKSTSSTALSHESVASSSHCIAGALREVVELTDESDDDPIPSRKRKPSAEIPNGRHPLPSPGPRFTASPSPDVFSIKQEYDGSFSDPILLSSSDTDDSDEVKSWPRDFFAIDIVACFTAVRNNSEKARGHRETIKTIFENYFDSPFYTSTFYDHYARWTSAPQAAKDKALSGRRTPAGSWARFMANNPAPNAENKALVRKLTELRRRGRS